MPETPEVSEIPQVPIDYLRDVRELELAGLSDLQISQHLASKTTIALSNRDSRVFLQENLALIVDPITNNNAGSLIEHYSSLPEGQERHLLGWFMTNCLSSDDFVSTDQYPRSIQLAEVLAGLPEEMDDLRDGIIDIGRGQPHLGTTEADVAASREAYEANQEAEAEKQRIREQVDAKNRRFFDKRVEYIQPLIDASVVDDETWIAAIEFMASTWSE